MTTSHNSPKRPCSVDSSWLYITRGRDFLFKTVILRSRRNIPMMLWRKVSCLALRHVAREVWINPSATEQSFRSLQLPHMVAKKEAGQSCSEKLIRARRVRLKDGYVCPTYPQLVDEYNNSGWWCWCILGQTQLDRDLLGALPAKLLSVLQAFLTYRGLFLALGH